MRACARFITTKGTVMKLNIYSIFDTASGLYSRPFFTQSDGEAKRSFSDIATDAEHPIGKHPADYTLFRIGIFDDCTGKIINENNEAMLNALNAIARAQNVERDNLDLFDKQMTPNAVTPEGVHYHDGEKKAGTTTEHRP